MRLFARGWTKNVKDLIIRMMTKTLKEAKFEINYYLLTAHRLVGQVVKAPVSRVADTVRFSLAPRESFRVDPETTKLALLWLPSTGPGDTGSVLELVGPVSVHCEWVK